MQQSHPKFFDRDALLKCAKGELFGPGNAQLPAPPMLMMDRITDVSSDGGNSGAGHIKAELEVNSDLWFFPCHFPGNLVMPGCLMLDGLWQLTGFNLGWRSWEGSRMAMGVKEVKLVGMVHPRSALLTYHIEFKRIVNRRLKLGVADGEVQIDGKPVCQVKGLRVGLARA
ncbi:MAG: bifunctional 3-hydroxydecanoyl-ACP dehydratase/trans-2-decenoyl-ACP isomerase [Paracoccaceae bacterium]